MLEHCGNKECKTGGGWWPTQELNLAGIGNEERGAGGYSSAYILYMFFAVVAQTSIVFCILLMLTHTNLHRNRHRHRRRRRHRHRYEHIHAHAHTHMYKRARIRAHTQPNKHTHTHTRTHTHAHTLTLESPSSFAPLFGDVFRAV